MRLGAQASGLLLEVMKSPDTPLGGGGCARPWTDPRPQSPPCPLPRVPAPGPEELGRGGRGGVWKPAGRPCVSASSLFSLFHPLGSQSCRPAGQPSRVGWSPRPLHSASSLGGGRSAQYTLTLDKRQPGSPGPRGLRPVPLNQTRQTRTRTASFPMRGQGRSWSSCGVWFTSCRAQGPGQPEMGHQPWWGGLWGLRPSPHRPAFL